jgi:hypothetical protein
LSVAADYGLMNLIQEIAAVVIGTGAAAFFALMAWAGQHVS